MWESRRGPEALLPLGVALERLAATPDRALDVGTGTGKAARMIARLFPEANVVGVDLSPRMVEEARRLLPDELVGRVRFEVADASRLPFADGAFDLVVLLNMIPFFDELDRVTAPAGSLVFAFYSGAATPMYTPTAILRERLEGRFENFQEFAAGEGTAVLARKRRRG